MTEAQIFQILGLIYFSVGLGILLNRELYQRLMATYGDNLPGVYLGGVMAFVVGFLLVTFHNVWSLSWGVIITVIGWLALIKGVVILALPGVFLGILHTLKQKQSYLTFSWIFALLLGALLIYLGFWGL